MNPPAGSLVRLLVVDRHPLFLRGFRAFVEETPDFHCVGTASTVESAARKIEASLTNVVLIDARLGMAFGFKKLEALRSGGHAVRWIALADAVEEDTIHCAVTDGVQGFLFKSTPLEELANAIRLVHQGQQAIDPAATEALLHRFRADLDPSPVRQLASLSPQENRVLAQVAEGKTNKEIGRELQLSEKTVKNYLSKVLEKLGVHRRAQAAAFHARHCSKR